MYSIYGHPSKSGPEAEIVYKFLDADPFECSGNWQKLIFVEPYLQNTIPDIVVVYFDLSAAETWSRRRLQLNHSDLRLVQALTLGGFLESHLQKIFPRNLAKSLNKLEKAEMIEKSDAIWHIQDLKKIFAVRRLVAVEAKVSALSKAINQAFLNTYFSSESYVLTGEQKPSETILTKARRQGIGFWSFSNTQTPDKIIKAKELPLPQSYISWFFNELAWKSTLGVNNVVKIRC